MDHNSIETDIANNVARGLVETRKKFNLSKSDERICILEPWGDLSILNIFVRHFNDIICNRTSISDCYVLTNCNKMDFSFEVVKVDYFNSHVDAIENREKQFNFLVSFVNKEEIDCFNENLIKLQQNASWSHLFHNVSLFKSPVSWRDTLEK